MPLMMSVRYTKHLRNAPPGARQNSARGHLGYIAFRERYGSNERYGVFDRDWDNADVKRFFERLDDPLTRDPPGKPPRWAKMHMFLFTLSEDEYRRTGLPSWRPVIREAFAHVEKLYGIRLDWVAAEHLSHGHPHVHVAMKSVYLDSQGVPQRLNVTPQMREAFRLSVQYVLRREREARRQEYLALRAAERARLHAERLHEHAAQHNWRTIFQALAGGMREQLHDEPKEQMPRRQQRRRRRKEQEHDER